jgi:hypothetical protein
MEIRRNEMRDGTSIFCQLSLKYTGMLCGCCNLCHVGVVTYVIVPITFVRATNLLLLRKIKCT